MSTIDNRKSITNQLAVLRRTMTMRDAHLSADARRDAVQLLDVRNRGNLTATEAGKA